jgi:hypothetical protein
VVSLVKGKSRSVAVRYRIKSWDTATSDRYRYVVDPQKTVTSPLLCAGTWPTYISPGGGQQQAVRQQVLCSLPGAPAVSPGSSGGIHRLPQEKQGTKENPPSVPDPYLCGLPDPDP